MAELTRSEVNERLAVWRGWKKAADGYWIEPYTPKPRSRVWSKPPGYCTSLDLLRRDVLPMLSITQWRRFTCPTPCEFDSNKETWAEHYLTAPAETIARAALKALEGK